MTQGDAGRVPRRRAHPFLLVLAFSINLMTIALSAWGVAGVPFRTLATVAVLAVCMVFHQRAFMRALVLHRRLLFLFGGFALLGTVVSLLNDTAPAIVARQVAEIHVQGALNLVFAATIVELCGAAPVLWAFVVPVALSVLVATAQFMGVDAAWRARVLLGAWQHEAVRPYGYLDDRRAMGLSYSPITFATQLCLAFAGYGILREWRARRPRAIDLRVVAALLLFAAACVSSGNRSPLVGALLFALMYVARRKPVAFWAVLLPLGVLATIVLGPFAMEALGASDLRVAQTGDKSSLGRVTLFYYGVLLFVHRPIGYGLDFDPTRYWERYWPQVADMPDPTVIQGFPLHNYVLGMLNFYGVGMILLGYLIHLVLRDYRWTALMFVPYAFHIMFHNSGPFWGDPSIWTIAAVAAGLKRREQRRPPPPPRRPIGARIAAIARRMRALALRPRAGG